MTEPKTDEAADAVLARIGLPANLGTPQSFDLGEVLMREGEQGTCMFVILSGMVEVTTDGQLLAIIEAGELLGEMALVDDGPRSATAVAVAPTQTCRVERAQFDALMGGQAPLGRFLMRMLSGRLRRTNQVAAAGLAALPGQDEPPALPPGAAESHGPTAGARPAGEKPGAPRGSEVKWRG